MNTVLETPTPQILTHRLTAEQLRCIDELYRFMSTKDDRRLFTVFGLAGTGKTTVLSTLARKLSSWIFIVAPTGKAASVLAKKTEKDAMTIHRLLYPFPVKIKDEKTGKPKLIFPKKSWPPGALKDYTILVDEVSMVGSKLFADLWATGAKIVCFGDPGQLAPVQDIAAVESANFTLTKVLRQAENNPIIRQAHRVRSGYRYKSDGDSFRVLSGYNDRLLLAADMIITWRKESRARINQAVRKLKGFQGYPRKGDTIMAYGNSKGLKILKGDTFILTEPRPGSDSPLCFRNNEGQEWRLEPSEFLFFDTANPPETNDDEADTRLLFSFGYAMTCHYAQGSEFDHVLIIDEFNGAPETRKKWLYTAITRAKERVTIIPYH